MKKALIIFSVLLNLILIREAWPLIKGRFSSKVRTPELFAETISLDTLKTPGTWIILTLGQSNAGNMAKVYTPHMEGFSIITTVNFTERKIR